LAEKELLRENNALKHFPLSKIIYSFPIQWYSFKEKNGFSFKDKGKHYAKREEKVLSSPKSNTSHPQQCLSHPRAYISSNNIIKPHITTLIAGHSTLG
jgi:hypothetical protein